MNESKLSFEMSREDRAACERLGKRAYILQWAEIGDEATDQISWAMAFAATHCNGTPLDLPGLETARDEEFFNDAGVIESGIDCNTGLLQFPEKLKFRKIMN